LLIGNARKIGLSRLCEKRAYESGWDSRICLQRGASFGSCLSRERHRGRNTKGRVKNKAEVLGGELRPREPFGFFQCWGGTEKLHSVVF